MNLQEEYSVNTSGATVTVKTPEREATYNLPPQPDFWRVAEEISILAEKIDKLNHNIEHLIRLMNPPVQQLLVEPMTLDQAKELVSAYMKEHRTASISELAEQLQIDLQTLCEVIDKFREEGHIRERE